MRQTEAGSGNRYGTIGQLLRFRHGIFSAIARRNLAFNRQISVSGPVHGQRRPPVRDLRYGIVRAAWSGCGLIAVYNALLLLGNPHPLWDVFAWGDLKGAALFGIFGTSHRRAGRLFRQLGYTVTAVTNPSLFDACAQRAEACLFTYWNRKGRFHKGMHTVCTRWREGALEVYNLYNNSEKIERLPSFEEWCKRGIGPVALYCVSRNDGTAISRSGP